MIDDIDRLKANAFHMIYTQLRRLANENDHSPYWPVALQQNAFNLIMGIVQETNQDIHDLALRAAEAHNRLSYVDASPRAIASDTPVRESDVTRVIDTIQTMVDSNAVLRVAEPVYGRYTEGNVPRPMETNTTDMRIDSSPWVTR